MAGYGTESGRTCMRVSRNTSDILKHSNCPQVYHCINISMHSRLLLQ